MNTAKKWIAYIAYIAALTLLFLYVLFPDDAVRRYIEFRTNQAAAEMQLNIEQLSLDLPPGVRLRNVDLKYDNMPPLRIDHAAITPAYMSLLGSERRFHIHGQVAGGTVRGETRISGNRTDVDARFTLDAIGIDAIPAIKQMSKYRISGKLGGTVDYTGSIKQLGSGNAQLVAVDCSIGFDAPLFGVDSLNFREISAVFEMERQRVMVKELNFDGDQVSGKGSGNIMLSAPVANSRINLTGTLTPHPSLLKSIGGVFPKQYLRDGRVPVRITGTLGHPRLSMQ